VGRPGLVVCRPKMVCFSICTVETTDATARMYKICNMHDEIQIVVFWVKTPCSIIHSVHCA
jgi:hypothetical protein